MKITTDRLKAAKACKEHMDIFEHEYPDGVEPSVEALFEAAAAGLDVVWTWHLLPAEGPGSQRAYALWCAEQVAYLCDDQRVVQCLGVVRQRVTDPTSVDDVTLWAASDAARDAARSAARSAAYAARDAAREAVYAARAAAREAVYAARAAAREAAWYAAYTGGDAAREAVYAARAAAREAAWYAAYTGGAAAWDAARDAAYAVSDAQIACLAHMLMEAE